MSIALRPYQLEALTAIEAAAARGVRRPLLQLPTGTGKTVMFPELGRRRGGRMLIIAHRAELLDQARDKLLLADPTAEVGTVKADRDEHTAPIVVASVQTLSRPERLQRVTPDFTTVIVDEAHHATAESYGRLLEHFGSFADDGPLTLGVTATPERGDGTGLDEVFEEIVYQRTILSMIREGYLCDLRAVQVRLKADFSGLHTRAGDFIEREVEELMLAADAPGHVVAAYQAHAAGRKALAFTPTVALAHEMADCFSAAGIPAEALDASTSADERKAILARFREGKTRIIPNCAILTEGYDEPSIECIIVARPTKSRPFYQQMIGRGTRTYPSKKDCLILDVVGATTRHDLMTSATLFGIEPETLAAETVGAVDARLCEGQERQRQQGELIARAVDLFQQRELNWIQADGGQFILSLGKHGFITLARSDDAWSVLFIQGGDRKVLADGLDLGYAMGTAEDHARRLGQDVLLDRSASWRQLDPTDKQITVLTRRNLPWQPGMTRGDASDLLSVSLVGARR